MTDSARAACRDGAAGRGVPGAHVVRKLCAAQWASPLASAGKFGLVSVSSMCDRWADEFEHKYAAGDPRLRLDPGLARAGIELFRALPRTADREVLLYTDMHPENVLAARREPWLAIDPKPYVGDPTYDALQHMLNHPARLATDPTGFVGRMAELLDLEPSRLRNWLFARSVQESIDAPNLREVAIALRP